MVKSAVLSFGKEQWHKKPAHGQTLMKLSSLRVKEEYRFYKWQYRRQAVYYHSALFLTKHVP